MKNNSENTAGRFEEQRLQAVYRYGILDTAPSSEFDSLTRLALCIAKVPIAFISFIDQDRQWFKSVIGLNWKEVNRSVSFCTYALEGKNIFIVEDAGCDPRFSDNPLVMEDPQLRFYAAVPVVTPEGYAIGTLAVIDRVPRKLSSDSITALKILADEVMMHVTRHLERQTYLEAERDRREIDRKATVLMQNLPGMAYRCRLDAHWTMEFVSDGVERLTGYRAADLLDNAKISYAELIHPDDRGAVADAVEEALYAYSRFTLTYRIRHACGETRWVWEQGIAVRSSTEKVIALEGFITDITAQKKAELRLAESEERWRFAVESAGEGIWDQNLPENRIYLSPRCKEMLGYDDHEIGTDLARWTHLVHPDDLDHLLLARKRIISGEDMIATDERRQHKDGSWRLIHKRGMVVSRDPSGRPVRMIGTYTDVTETRKERKALLSQARMDVLTGLPNRRMFQERLHEVVINSTGSMSLCAVLFIDLDGFKAVNDTLGHEQGDRLLVRVSQRLTNCVRDTDMVARLGGDEFTIILVSPQSEESVKKIAQTVVDRLREPYRMDGDTVTLSASLGIAICPHAGREAHELLHHADQAMYRAKHKGKNRFSD